MLSDDDVVRIAQSRMREAHGEDWLADVYFTADPPGGWAEPRHRGGGRFTGSPSPFFVDRRDGAVVTPGDEDWSRALRALRGWLAAGVPGAKEFAAGPPAPGAEPRVWEAWVRAVLVAAAPRYAHLRVPTPKELPPAAPTRRWRFRWRFW